ncbi:unnamed protein product [Periconia digitata]|uniref:Uncharacterized protein n=1 Tax=Periconia digitata TaxID=1303443 RepID=A0A9W4U2M9_9PLEO|nr:unnamed protein product [Periconia digitata]
MVAHRRGPWSQHEDRWLVELVNRNGPHNWVRISQEIGSRSPKQCRERFHQNLKPTLNHEPITPEEGELIEKLVQEMGKRWAEIARRLKGRSDNAVKNWWNGGQNRRKRNPERPDQRDHQQMHQSPYHYPTIAQSGSHHDEEPAHHLSHVPSYSQSRRPSLGRPMHSPRALKFSQPQSYEPYPGSRPAPLELHPYPSQSSARGRGFETPMPSPSGYSIVSADGAPSLITDTGSESRSPRGAASPLDLTLAPLVGSREERRNSCTRYLPQSGFAVEDDATYDHYRRPGSVQLPPLTRTESLSSAPSYQRPERPQLLTQTASSHMVHHHTLPQSAPVTTQRALPSFSTLAEPGRVPLPSPSMASPANRQLPSPFARPNQLSETRSAPVSPRALPQDSRMSLKNIM